MCGGVGGDGVGYADVGDGCMGKHLDTHAETIRVCVCGVGVTRWDVGVWVYVRVCIYAPIGVGVCACVYIYAPIGVVVDTLGWGARRHYE